MALEGGGLRRVVASGAASGSESDSESESDSSTASRASYLSRMWRGGILFGFLEMSWQI